MQPDQTPRQVDSSTDRPASAQRRREILKRIGQTSILMGAATPLSALATGGYTVTNVRKWCKPSGTKIGASISGAMSVVISATAGGQSYGQGCNYYKTHTTSCHGSTFVSKFPSCLKGSGKKDSNNKKQGDPGCLFDMTFQDLFNSYSTTPEAHWAAAYCNTQGDSGSLNFPYQDTDVANFFAADNSAAYQFFCNNMEAGNTGL